MANALVWQAFLVDMKTGAVGAKLPLLGGSWREVVNGTDEADLSVSRRALLRVAEAQRTPWQAGVLLTVDQQPLIAGPLVRRPKWGKVSASLAVRGIRAWMAKGHVRGYDLADRIEGGPSDLIAGWATRLGGLPIVVSDADFGVSAGVDGWDLGNSNLDEMLESLAELGPDLSIRPEWVDDTHTHIRWRVRTGTLRNELVPMGRTPLQLDATAARSLLVESPVLRTDWDPVTRVYVLGAGQGASQLIAVVDNEELLARGMPILEAALEATSSEDLAELTLMGQAFLRERAAPVREWEVAVDSSRAHPASWWAGDLVRFDPGSSEPDVESGLRDTVCLGRSGSVRSRACSADLQELV